MSDMTEAPNFNASTGVRNPAVAVRQNTNLDYFGSVSLRISVEVGSTALPLSEILLLGEGSVVELDRQANDVLDIFANGSLIARGEVVTVDERYAVRVTEVVPANSRAPRQERRN